MKYTTAILALTCLVVAQYESSDSGADVDSEDDYLQEVCMPTNSTGDPDFNAPCNAALLILEECAYGPAYVLSTESDDDNDNDLNIPTQDNSTQRACICESQWWDMQAGCAACYVAHGSTDDGDAAPFSTLLAELSSVSTLYCAASATPTLDFGDYLELTALALFPDQATQSFNTDSLDATATSILSDPVGNHTEVSYYYTPKVTGSAAYIVAEATGTGSATLGQITSLNIVNGQIVATASQNEKAASVTGSSSSHASGSTTTSGTASGSASAASGGSTTSGNSGARQTVAAAVGVLGVAGLAVFL